MKGKANMPSFLLNELNGSEDEDEEEEDGEVTNTLNNLDIHSQQHTGQNQVPAVFEPELPLSRAPSPFLSEEKYKSCHEAWQAQKLADFNQKHAVINVKKVFYLHILAIFKTALAKAF